VDFGGFGKRLGSRFFFFLGGEPSKSPTTFIKLIKIFFFENRKIFKEFDILYIKKSDQPNFFFLLKKREFFLTKIKLM
jgi:hypothetical protein